MKRFLQHIILILSLLLASVSSLAVKVLLFQLDETLNISGTLPDHVQLVRMNRINCEPYFSTDIFTNFLIESFYQEIGNNSDFMKLPVVAGVIGIDCASDIRMLSQLSSHSRVQVPVFSSSFTALNTESNTYYMASPGTVISKGVLSLLQDAKWTRIGMITEPFYNADVGRILLKELSANGVYIHSYIEVNRHHHPHHVVRYVQQSAVRVILISVLSSEFICEALQYALLRYNMTWPNNAWLIYGHFAMDLLNANSCCLQCLEGVILINQDFQQSFGGTAKIVHSGIILDSISALKHALEQTNYSPRDLNLSAVSFSGITGRIDFSNDHYIERNMIISQIIASKEVYVATFYATNNSIHISNRIQSGSISTELPKIYPNTIPLSFACTSITVFTIIVTIVLFLYLCYRNEQEIKATSVSLSLLMFLGCYLLLLFLVLLAVESSLTDVPPNFDICAFLLWLSGPGIPIPLILATLLVKISRIYKIFKSYVVISKLIYRDFMLAVYVLVLLSPNILVLSLCSTDLIEYPFTITYVNHTNHIEVVTGCTGNIDIPLVCLLVYLFVLIVAVCVIAIKTRKLRIRMFSDTKKVNGFLFVLILLTVISLSLWWIFENYSHDNLQSDIILHVGTVMIIISCQAFLFIPKVLPPLKRSLFVAFHSQKS